MPGAQGRAWTAALLLSLAGALSLVFPGPERTAGIGRRGYGGEREAVSPIRRYCGVYGAVARVCSSPFFGSGAGGTARVGGGGDKNISAFRDAGTTRPGSFIHLARDTRHNESGFPSLYEKKTTNNGLVKFDIPPQCKIVYKNIGWRALGENWCKPDQARTYFS